jgi:hypothetical protein
MACINLHAKQVGIQAPYRAASEAMHASLHWLHVPSFPFVAAVNESLCLSDLFTLLGERDIPGSRTDPLCYHATRE